MITGYLIGDRALVAKMDAAPARMKASLDKIVQQLGFALQLRVQRDYLRGPRPGHLGVRTARLIGSITQGAGESRSRFETTPVSALAFVGTNVPYGTAWEYGFTKRTGAGARGGKFANMSGAAKGAYWAAHPPGMKNVAARPFLAPALADMRQIIVDQLSQGLQKTAVEVFK